MKLFTTLIEENLHTELKKLSNSTGKKIIKLVEEALIDLIKKYGINQNEVM